MNFFQLNSISSFELRRLKYVVGIFFLIMFGISIGRIGRDTIFIQNIGANGLSIIYICNALLMIVVSAIYSRIYDRLSRVSFLLALLCMAAMLLIVLQYFLAGSSTIYYYLLFVATEAIILTIPIHFWTFANEVFDPRQGKRIFPMIGGAGLLGTIAGALLTGLFSKNIGSSNLLLMWAGLFILAAPFVLRFRHLFGRISAQGRGKADEESLWQNLESIMKIPLVKTLTWMALPMWMTVYLIDFQYFKALEEAFQNPDDMSTAMGIVQGISSGFGLLVQLFVTSFLLTRFGIGKTIVIYPFSMILGSFALVGRLFSFSQMSMSSISRFLPAAFARLSDESVVNSIGESSFQLLYNSIADEWRGHARAFISGIMEPFSIALAGIVLLLLTQFEVPGYVLPGLSLFMALLWLRFSFRIRKDYISSLVSNLSSHNMEIQNQVLSEMVQGKDVKSTGILFESIFSEDESESILAAELLSRISSQSLLVKVAQKIDQIPSSRVQILILNLISDHQVLDALPFILILLKSKHAETRAACIKTVAALDDAKALKIARPFIEDENMDVRAEALIAVSRYGKALNKGSKAYKILDQMIHSKKIAHRISSAYVITQTANKQFLDVLVKMSQTRSIALKRQVIKALGILGNESTVKVLCSYFKEERLVYHVMEALQNLGQIAIDPMIDLLHKEKNNIKKKYIIVCLGKTKNPQVIRALSGFLVNQSIDIENTTLEALVNLRLSLSSQYDMDTINNNFFGQELREKLLRGITSLTNTMVSRSIIIKRLELLEDSDAKQLLIDALERSYTRKKSAALKYLELIEDPAIIRAVETDLNNLDSRARAEAIEIIEGVSAEGKKLAMALEQKDLIDVEDMPELSHEVLSTLFMNLMVSKEMPWFYSCIIFAIGYYKLVELKHIVKSSIGNENLLIDQNARLAYWKLSHKQKKQPKEIQNMAINMERIVFLRSVNLFEEVDGDDIYWINEITRKKNVKKGEYIFHENDQGDALYIIVKGSVRIYKGKNEALVLDVLTKRDSFGEMAILDQGPRSATVKAIANTELLVIMQEDFQRLLVARPQIVFSLFKTLSEKVRQLSTRLEEAQNKK